MFLQLKNENSKTKSPPRFPSYQNSCNYEELRPPRHYENRNSQWKAVKLDKNNKIPDQVYKDIKRHILAFSNTPGGGHITFGIEEIKVGNYAKVNAIKLEKAMKQDIEKFVKDINFKYQTTSTVECLEMQQDLYIVVVKVNEVKTKPLCSKPKLYTFANDELMVTQFDISEMFGFLQM